MKLRVTNNQRYALGRRGHVFPPGETVEVEVYADAAYREIRASRYLDVEVLDSGSPEPVQTYESTVTVESTDLYDKTVSELRDMAADKGIEVPAGTVKADLVAMLTEAEDS